MTFNITTTFSIAQPVISRAVTNFIEDCGYCADSIKEHYLDYVLSIAIPYEDEVIEFIEKSMSADDKEKILFAFVTELEEQFHRDIENALEEEEEDC